MHLLILTLRYINVLKFNIDDDLITKFVYNFIIMLNNLRIKRSMQFLFSIIKILKLFYFINKRVIMKL